MTAHFNCHSSPIFGGVHLIAGISQYFGVDPADRRIVLNHENALWGIGFAAKRRTVRFIRLRDVLSCHDIMLRVSTFMGNEVLSVAPSGKQSAEGRSCQVDDVTISAWMRLVAGKTLLTRSSNSTNV